MADPTKDRIRVSVLSLLRTLGAPQSVLDKAEREIADADYSAKQPTEAPAASSPASTITLGEEAMLTTLADGLTDLHDHLCPRIKAVKEGLIKTDENSLKRDSQLRDQITNLTRDSGARLIALENALASLTSEFRKQAGLLHKRVTKRKQEISTKSNKRKSNRVSDHSAD